MKTFVKIICVVFLILAAAGAFFGTIELFTGSRSEGIEAVQVIVGSMFASLIAGCAWLFANWVPDKSSGKTPLPPLT